MRYPSDDVVVEEVVGVVEIAIEEVVVEVVEIVGLRVVVVGVVVVVEWVVVVGVVVVVEVVVVVGVMVVVVGVVVTEKVVGIGEFVVDLEVVVLGAVCLGNVIVEGRVGGLVVDSVIFSVVDFTDGNLVVRIVLVIPESLSVVDSFPLSIVEVLIVLAG